MLEEMRSVQANNEKVMALAKATIAEAEQWDSKVAQRELEHQQKMQRAEASLVVREAALAKGYKNVADKEAALDQRSKDDTAVLNDRYAALDAREKELVALRTGAESYVKKEDERLTAWEHSLGEQVADLDRRKEEVAHEEELLVKAKGELEEERQQVEKQKERLNQRESKLRAIMANDVQ
jgi:hypothetical protein